MTPQLVSALEQLVIGIGDKLTREVEKEFDDNAMTTYPRLLMVYCLLPTRKLRSEPRVWQIAINERHADQAGRASAGKPFCTP